MTKQEFKKELNKWSEVARQSAENLLKPFGWHVTINWDKHLPNEKYSFISENIQK